jgi:AcrR family transcriptional regulator
MTMGRPRSARAHDHVLEAAMELIAQRGVDATSMDAIAGASGVSKATIYRHWPDKDSLCIEVLTRLHGDWRPSPSVASSDVRADIIGLLDNEPSRRHAGLRMRIMPHLAAYAARKTRFGKAWLAHVFEPPRIELARLLKRAVAEGRLSPALDVDLALALLLGPMMYGHIARRIGAAPPPKLAPRVLDAFWKAYGVSPPVRTAGRQKVRPDGAIGDKHLPPSPVRRRPQEQGRQARHQVPEVE